MRQKRGKKVSRSKEARNDMEEKQEVRKVRRIFTPEQKLDILKDIQRCATLKEGRSVSEVLGTVGVARSSYYRWKKGEGEKKDERPSSYELTVEERQMIEAVKESHPEYRHRRIQGMLQQQGVYLSASAIYGHLKELGQVEPYDRRAAPSRPAGSGGWGWHFMRGGGRR